jgi:hypothetical protein
MAWLSFLAFTLVAPPAISLKSNPSTCAWYSEITLLQPNWRSPEVTPLMMGAPPARGSVSSSKPSALKNPFSIATNIAALSTIFM